MLTNTPSEMVDYSGNQREMHVQVGEKGASQAKPQFLLHSNLAKEEDEPRVIPTPPVNPQNTPPDIQESNGEMEGIETLAESRSNDHGLYSKRIYNSWIYRWI